MEKVRVAYGFYVGENYTKLHKKKAVWKKNCSQVLVVKVNHDLTVGFHKGSLLGHVHTGSPHFVGVYKVVLHATKRAEAIRKLQ